jgi:hypothetical protein
MGRRPRGRRGAGAGARASAREPRAGPGGVPGGVDHVRVDGWCGLGSVRWPCVVGQRLCCTECDGVSMFRLQRLSRAHAALGAGGLQPWDQRDGCEGVSISSRLGLTTQLLADSDAAVPPSAGSGGCLGPATRLGLTGRGGMCARCPRAVCAHYAHTPQSRRPSPRGRRPVLLCSGPGTSSTPTTTPGTRGRPGTKCRCSRRPASSRTRPRRLGFVFGRVLGPVLVRPPRDCRSWAVGGPRDEPDAPGRRASRDGMPKLRALATFGRLASPAARSATRVRVPTACPVQADRSA